MDIAHVLIALLVAGGFAFVLLVCSPKRPLSDDDVALLGCMQLLGECSLADLRNAYESKLGHAVSLLPLVLQMERLIRHQLIAHHHASTTTGHRYVITETGRGARRAAAIVRYRPRERAS